MSRTPGALTMYLCRDGKGRHKPRLVVARSFAQADSMVPAGWNSKVASPFDAYSACAMGVQLEYYYVKKETA